MLYVTDTRTLHHVTDTLHDVTDTLHHVTDTLHHVTDTCREREEAAADRQDREGRAHEEKKRRDSGTDSDLSDGDRGEVGGTHAHGAARHGNALGGMCLCTHYSSHS